MPHPLAIVPQVGRMRGEPSRNRGPVSSRPAVSVAPVPSGELPVPHISLEDPGNTSLSSTEWFKWLLLLALFAGSAAAAYFYFFQH